MPHSVLVVGTGSIGARHIENLLALGASVSTYSYRGPGGEALWRDRVSAHASLSAALAAPVDAIVVANSTDQHMEVALAGARAGRALFIEKPLSNSLALVADLEQEAAERGLVVETGFMLRFHPNLQWLRQFLADGGVGDVHYARALVGQYLPDWRPGQDHRESYSARRGCGGVILDLVHELDVIAWLLGPLADVQAMTAMTPSLDIETEAIAQVGVRCENGILAQVHMDYLRPVYGRTLEIVGATGIAVWDYSAGTVTVTRRDGAAHIAHAAGTFVRNDLFLSYMRHFLDRLSDSARPAAASLADGVAALRAALACHQSARERRVVRPADVDARFSLTAAPS